MRSHSAILGHCAGVRLNTGVYHRGITQGYNTGVYHRGISQGWVL